MAIGIEGIIWYIILLDSVGANIVAWCCAKWYKKNMTKGIVKHFPATKGWCLWYFILVLWVGYGLSRLGLLGL